MTDLTLLPANPANADGNWFRLDGVHVTHEAGAAKH